MTRAPDVEVKRIGFRGYEVTENNMIRAQFYAQFPKSEWSARRTPEALAEAFLHASDFANKLAEEMATKETQR